MRMSNGVSSLEECKSPIITPVKNPEKNSSTMAISSPTKRPFFVIDLSGKNSNPMIPDSFITTGKLQSSKLKLTSDASDRIWEVEVDGRIFAGGWKDFSVSHCVRHDDVLSFRQDEDMVFHVTPFGRSFSTIHSISSTSDDDDDDDVNDHTDAEDDYDNSTPQEEMRTPRVRTKAESSSDLVAHVTPSSLSRDHLCLIAKFARSNGLNERQCEMELMNEDEKSWTVGLNYNRTSGQTFVRGGWRSFCRANRIKAGSFCRFKLVQSGTKPVLQLCPNPNSSSIPEPNSSKAKGKRNASQTDDIETDENQNKIVTLELKHYMFRSTQLLLPAAFTRENGIEQPGDITIVNEDGVEWKSHLVNLKGRRQFYLNGYKDIFLANGVKKVGDCFTLEAIRGGATPILKLCPKVKQAPIVDGFKTPEGTPRMTVRATRAEKETETRVQKRARISEEGGSSRRTRTSNKTSDEPGNLQRKQTIQPCSIADLVEKVKQRIVNSLTGITRAQSELERDKQNLEAAVLEIDALGGKIKGISKMF